MPETQQAKCPSVSARAHFSHALHWCSPTTSHTNGSLLVEKAYKAGFYNKCLNSNVSKMNMLLHHACGNDVLNTCTVHVILHVVLPSLAVCVLVGPFSKTSTSEQLVHTTGAPKPSSSTSNALQQGGIAWHGFLQTLQKCCPHSFPHVTQTTNFNINNIYNLSKPFNRNAHLNCALCSFKIL